MATLLNTPFKYWLAPPRLPEFVVQQGAGQRLYHIVAADLSASHSCCESPTPPHPKVLL